MVYEYFFHFLFRRERLICFKFLIFNQDIDTFIKGKSTRPEFCNKTDM